MSAPHHSRLARWVNWVTHHPALVLILAGVLTVAAGAYAFTHLKINTSTTDLISSDVEFRQNAIDYREAFPQFKDLLLVVIDGASAEAREAAAAELAELLRAREDIVLTVYDPGSDPHFEQQGLMYLSLDELAELSDRLAASQPLIAQLNEDPTLRGMAGLLELALTQGTDSEGIEGLVPVLEQIASVMVATAENRPGTLSWQQLVVGEAGGGRLDKQFLLVQPRLNGEGFSPAKQALAAVRELSAEAGITEERGMRLRLTGPPALEQEELRSVTQSIGVSGLLSLLFVTVLLVLGLRSGRLILAVLTPLIAGIIWTAAYAALVVGQFNLISVAFAVLFVGLSVDFGIHFSLRYREAVEAGAAHKPALPIAVDSVGGALLLSAVCAAIGFFAFVPTEYQGLAELGIISGGSMFIALAANLTVTPAILSLMPVTRLGTRAVPNRPVGHALERLVRNYSAPILMVAGGLVVAAAILAPQVEFDVNPLNLQNPEAESVATYMELAQDKNTSPYLINVVADDLDQAVALKNRLRPLPEVARVISIADLVPKDQDDKMIIIDELAIFMAPLLAGPDRVDAPTPDELRKALLSLEVTARNFINEPSEARNGEIVRAVSAFLGGLTILKESRGLTDEVMVELDRRLTGTLPRWLNRLANALSAQPFAIEDMPATLRTRWLTPDGRARVEVWPAQDLTDPANMRAFADTLLAVDSRATGAPVVVSEASRAVTRAFVKAMGLTLIAILILLAIIQRRPLDIVLTMSPLIFSALMLLALTVILDLPFNFANVIVLPLLFGLGVASSIHLVSRRRSLGDEQRLLRSSTPRAVLFSSLTTAASFGSLSVSDHRGTASMGILLTWAILLTLVSALIFLPSLMRSIEPRKRSELPDSSGSG